MITLIWILVVLAAVVVICRYGPLIEDYYADTRQAKRVVDAAECFCLQAVREENAALLDDLAALHPMPQRPPAAPAEPGEPWRLRHAADDVAPRLVDQGVPNETPVGEQL